MIKYVNSQSRLLIPDDIFKLPQINEKIPFYRDKPQGLILKPKFDSLDFLLKKDPQNHNNNYLIMPSYERKQEQKLVTEVPTGRLARRGSQILDGGSQMFVSPIKTQRKISQAEFPKEDALKNFFTLEPTDIKDKSPKKKVVQYTRKVPKRHKLENFTDWVEKLYGKDWFNVA